MSGQNRGRRPTNAGPHRQERTQRFLLSHMMSPGLERTLEQGELDVLIPLGSLEQHGPHLPLSTDSLIAEAVAQDVASRLTGTILVAPCLPVGYSPYHLGFAGTASIPEDVVTGFVMSVTTTLLGGGFRFAYLMSGHAGNIGAMRAAVDEMPTEFAARTALHGDWPSQRKLIHDWAEANLGLSAEQVGSHGGHFETSMLLHLAPHLVDMSLATPGHLGDADEASTTMLAEGMLSVSEAGIIGDPSSATAIAGAGYFRLVTRHLVDFITDHRRDNPTA